MWYQVACLLGGPALCAAAIRWMVGKMSELSKEMKANSAGTQALLRAQMISDYNKWSERGYAPIYAKENFENVWKNYHALGANGVMDGIHDEFMKLSTGKENAND